MKKITVKNLILMGSVLTLIGCGSESKTTLKNDNSSNTSKESLPTNVQSALEASSSTLTQALQDSITYMYSEEGLAHDVYLNINKIQPLNQLKNIATKSEVKHIEAVNKIAQKYDLNITKYPDTTKPYTTDDLKRYGSGEYPVEPIQELYNLLYDKGIQSKKDALEVGCMVEVVDIDDLNIYIAQAKDSKALDVLDVFHFLRDGSYVHYWAFDKGLKNMGIKEGCCIVPNYGKHQFCHPEYPNVEKGKH